MPLLKMGEFLQNNIARHCAKKLCCCMFGFYMNRNDDSVSLLASKFRFRALCTLAQKGVSSQTDDMHSILQRTAEEPAAVGT